MTIIAKRINIPVNRAEGDLEISVEIENGIITDAWSSGTMFRGFEEMMVGRGPLDGLVITPRICGICSLTHLNAAVEALDKIAGITPPDNALRLRNIALMVETMQSDLRQAILMFMADFANHKSYANHPLFAEAATRYKPLAGKSALSVIKESKRLLEIIAIIGGQWPHTSFMVPGGVTFRPEIAELLQCRMIYSHFLNWYEEKILGCSLAKWQSINSCTELDTWLEEAPSHANSEVGFFIRFARQAGLEKIGVGTNSFLSYGSLRLPRESAISGSDGHFMKAGFSEKAVIGHLDQELISEDLSRTWYKSQHLPLHPADGETIPYASGNDNGRYSWIKAPRYNGIAAETGPLAEAVIGNDKLFKDLLKIQGPNVMVRELARLLRPAKLLPVMMTWFDELITNRHETFYTKVKEIPDGSGVGMIQAARGALGHWVEIRNQSISRYQIITPTAWNGSPRDESGQRGPWEEALIGTPIKDEQNPIEAGHVVRSFDPCLVCAVHTVKKQKKVGHFKLGI